MKHAWFLALAGALFTTVAAAQQRAPVVVELFTSQGCSSCPTADRLLQELAERGDVLALAFHVDYWDYLGWKDTLATRNGTARQYAYRESLQERMLFTPQIVVDGRASISGTDRAAVLTLIERENARPVANSIVAPLLIESSLLPDGSIRLRLPACSTVTGQIPLWLIEYDERQTVAIARGENAGNSFIYSHPVRGLRRIGEWLGKTEDLTLPPLSLAAGRQALVLAQDDHAGPIRAAGRLAQAR